MKGRFAALITIIIWGTTFVSTKILLESFRPTEILFIRFIIGFLTLTFIYPKRMRGTEIRQEIIFAAAGLTGICLYYLLENIALTFTAASNVGLIISLSPFFTALLSAIAEKEGRKNGKRFFLGFILAFIGIALISFNGKSLNLNPKGRSPCLMRSIHLVHLFTSDTQDKHIRIQHGSDNPQSFLL